MLIFTDYSFNYKVMKKSSEQLVCQYLDNKRK